MNSTTFTKSSSLKLRDVSAGAPTRKPGILVSQEVFFYIAQRQTRKNFYEVDFLKCKFELTLDL